MGLDLATEVAMKTPRARVVLRVSSDKQDEESQIETCRRRIAFGDAQAAWSFDERTGIYRAHDVHGDDLDAKFRAAVFEDAAAGKFERLVVDELSRWTRGGIVTVISDRDKLAKLGVTLVSVRQDWIANDMMLAIAAWTDADKLASVRHGTKRALAHRKELVRQHGGYRRQSDGKWVTRIGGRDVVPISDDAIALALKMRQEYRTNGYAYQSRPDGWRVIAARLCSQGYGVRNGKELAPFKHATVRLRCQQTLEKLKLEKAGKLGGS